MGPLAGLILLFLPLADAGCQLTLPTDATFGMVGQYHSGTAGTAPSTHLLTYSAPSASYSLAYNIGSGSFMKAPSTQCPQSCLYRLRAMGKSTNGAITSVMMVSDSGESPPVTGILYSAYTTTMVTGEYLYCATVNQNCGASVPLYLYYNSATDDYQLRSTSDATDDSGAKLANQGLPICYLFPAVATSTSSTSAVTNNTSIQANLNPTNRSYTVTGSKNSRSVGPDSRVANGYGRRVMGKRHVKNANATSPNRLRGLHVKSKDNRQKRSLFGSGDFLSAVNASALAGFLPAGVNASSLMAGNVSAVAGMLPAGVNASSLLAANGAALADALKSALATGGGAAGNSTALDGVLSGLSGELLEKTLLTLGLDLDNSTLDSLKAEIARDYGNVTIGELMDMKNLTSLDLPANLTVSELLNKIANLTGNHTTGAGFSRTTTRPKNQTGTTKSATGTAKNNITHSTKSETKATTKYGTHNSTRVTSNSTKNSETGGTGATTKGPRTSGSFNETKRETNTTRAEPNQKRTGTNETDFERGFESNSTDYPKSNRNKDGNQIMFGDNNSTQFDRRSNTTGFEREDDRFNSTRVPEKTKKDNGTEGIDRGQSNTTKPAASNRTSTTKKRDEKKDEGTGPTKSGTNNTRSVTVSRGTTHTSGTVPNRNTIRPDVKEPKSNSTGDYQHRNGTDIEREWNGTETGEHRTNGTDHDLRNGNGTESGRDGTDMESRWNTTEERRIDKGIDGVSGLPVINTTRPAASSTKSATAVTKTFATNTADQKSTSKANTTISIIKSSTVGKSTTRTTVTGSTSTTSAYTGSTTTPSSTTTNTGSSTSTVSTTAYTGSSTTASSTTAYTGSSTTASSTPVYTGSSTTASSTTPYTGSTTTGSSSTSTTSGSITTRTTSAYKYDATTDASGTYEPGDQVLGDGTVVRTNGDTIYPNGTVKTSDGSVIQNGVKIDPDGTVHNTDGSTQYPNGTIVYPSDTPTGSSSSSDTPVWLVPAIIAGVIVVVVIAAALVFLAMKSLMKGGAPARNVNPYNVPNSKQWPNKSARPSSAELPPRVAEPVTTAQPQSFGYPVQGPPNSLYFG